MDTDQTPTVELYRKARKISGVKKILIAYKNSLLNMKYMSL